MSVNPDIVIEFENGMPPQRRQRERCADDEPRLSLRKLRLFARGHRCSQMRFLGAVDLFRLNVIHITYEHSHDYPTYNFSATGS